MMNDKLTLDLLVELFEYSDGWLYWKESRSNVRSGSLAGSVSNRGYQRVGINGKSYLVHRLIYFMHHGYLPKYLDHIDGNKLNNHIENLREATWSQNQQNKKKYIFVDGKPTTSEYKGVSWNNRDRKWQVQININKKRMSLGYFDSETDAAFAYNMMATELFGDFAEINEV